MSSPAPAPDPRASIGAIFDGLTKALTSSVGSLTAAAAAIGLAANQFTTLAGALNKLWPKAPWLGDSIVVALLLFLTAAAVWNLIEKRRIKESIGGRLQPGYFNLQPREKEEGFERADNAHIETLQWIETSESPVLYLTGASGTGKSSVLAAWVLPKLKAAGHIVIRLRGYEDLLARIEEEVLKPGRVWERPSRGSGDLKALLTRAGNKLAPHRLIFVIDQFEEFLILKADEQQQAFREFLSSLYAGPLENVTFVFVFRSEYEGIIDSKGWPQRLLRINLWEIFAFDESAAQDFMNKSQKTLDPELLRTVLREASEIELGAAGLIRPITLNLCGLVLGRFASGLPSKFRGGLVRGFLRESISLPETRETASKIIPKLITRDVTKRPRTIAELASETGLSAEVIRACLYRLGREDRGIVRPLDNETQETWEISHDFLVPLLDLIVARWTTSLWRRCRPWLPWMGTAALALAMPILLSLKDPLHELADLGWTVHREGTKWNVSFDTGSPTKESLFALGDIPAAELTVGGDYVSDVSAVKNLKNLTALDVSGTHVSDVSALKNLKNLTSLDLSDTLVSDISSLKDLNSLISLKLGTISYSVSRTAVSDVSVLKALKSLTTLDLSRTKVSDVSPLKDLKSLISLDLSGGKVSDVSALRDLKSLTSLDLRDTQVSDVSALRDLKSLTSLDLSNTQVNDFSSLRNLENLRSLKLVGTRVSDLSFLRGLKSLKSLDLDDTLVRDVSALKDLKSLTSLSLAATGVSDVSALKELGNLTTLDLIDTRVLDVSALKDLKSLTSLSLAATGVSDVSALKELGNLTTLDLRNTTVSDVSALKNPKLSILR